MTTHRMSKPSLSFAEWADSQNNTEAEEKSNTTDYFAFSSVYNHINSVQDNVVTQFQHITHTLPEAGPLSAAYRTRVLQAVYLLLAAGFFGVCAIVIGKQY